MSGRARRSRRYWLLGNALAACLLTAAPAAVAQSTRAPRDSEYSRTTFGSSGDARRCNEAAAAGRTAEDDLAACTAALERGSLMRDGLIATRVNRGVVLLRRNDPAGALADFDAAIALDPENGDAHSNRGTALLVARQPGLAVDALTRALTLGPTEPHKAYYNRGAAREALGDLAGAYDDYSTALRIKPDWGPAEAEIARFVRSRQERLARIMGIGGAATPTPEGR
jgi:Tfp pilus assembly protein PilF